MIEHMQQENHEHEFSFKGLFVPFTASKAIIFILIIGLIVFFNGLFNTFVADDPPEITQNPVIQSIQNLPQFFNGSLFYMGPGQKLGGSFYRPLQSVLFSSIYSIFGPSYFMFHLFQMLLFIANACLVFLIFKKFLNKYLAFVLSLIFLVHPINSEVALYISATQEVLFLFFGLMSLWIVENYSSQKAYILSCLCLFFSILSKETGILFFVLVPLYVLFLKKKNILSLVGYCIPILGIYFLLRFNALGFTPAVTKNAPIQLLTLSQRLMNIPEIFLFYIKTFLFPLDLASVHHWVYKQIDFQHFFIPLFIDITFLAMVFFFGFYILKRSQKFFVAYIFFLLWFLAGMALHMQILPLDQTVAEQWFYFPVIGLLGMIGVALEVWKVNVRNIYLLSILIVIIAALCLRTFIRSFDWKDNFTLASHDITVSKEAYPLYHELSSIYIDRGQYQLAKHYAQISIQQFPYVFNYTDLGNAEFSLGNYQQAKKAYLTALKYGDNFTTYDNLAALYINYGDPKEGITLIKKLLKEKYPYDSRLWLYLAVLEYRLHNTSDAKAAIQYAYEYNSGLPEINPIYSTIMNNQPLHYSIGKH